MTELQQMAQNGFEQLLADAGISVRAHTGEEFKAIITELATLAEPVDIAQGKEPIYADIEAALGSTADPRTIRTITETETGRVHKVLKFLPRANAVTQKWLVESQRT